MTLKVKEIITHPGIPHRDEFYAISIILAHCTPRDIKSSTKNLPKIYRTDNISEEEFNDPQVWIVDVGGRYEPDKSNFDHHQFPREAPACCTLSLILKRFGIYESAFKAIPYLSTIELMDSKGQEALANAFFKLQMRRAFDSLAPELVAKYPNVDPFLLRNVARTAIAHCTRNADTRDRLISTFSDPCANFVIGQFETETVWKSEHNIWRYMQRFGHDLLSIITNFDNAMSHLRESGEIRTVEGYKILVVPNFMEKVAGLSQLVSAWRSEVAPDAIVSIAPDTRDPGLSVYRFEQEGPVDFTVLAGHPAVRFVHKNGFLLKTLTRDVEVALDLISRAIIR